MPGADKAAASSAAAVADPVADVPPPLDACDPVTSVPVPVSSASLAARASTVLRPPVAIRGSSPPPSDADGNNVMTSAAATNVM
jgi:hypothetical protein